MQPLCSPPPLSLATVALALLCLTAQAAGLNDTGWTVCQNANSGVYPAPADVPCSVIGQDGRYGRDAAATVGQLPKIGAGPAGFDYTKIANNGSILALGATLGGNPTDWACTLDNVTGLTWEMKSNTTTDLRFRLHKYTWFSSAVNNGGDAGSLGTNTCDTTLSGYANQCNTANYVLAINSASLCGQNDWRLPSVKELRGLVNLATSSPAIATSYFPNTESRTIVNAGFVDAQYWSASTTAGQNFYAWTVGFRYGIRGADRKDAANFVRLVRGGP